MAAAQWLATGEGGSGMIYYWFFLTY